MSEYIITKEQIEELNRALGGMKFATSWLSCYAIWDTSNIYPVMKSEHVAVDLPEIVRCRDCKFCHKNYCEKRTSQTVCPSEIFWIEVEPDGFCKWGERREVDA